MDSMVLKTHRPQSQCCKRHALSRRSSLRPALSIAGVPSLSSRCWSFAYPERHHILELAVEPLVWFPVLALHRGPARLAPRLVLGPRARAAAVMRHAHAYHADLPAVPPRHQAQRRIVAVECVREP